MLTSEMVVSYQNTIQYHNKEDDMNLHHHENLESCFSNNPVLIYSQFYDKFLYAKL